MKEQDSRSGAVDSDILQGKADVLRAVQASASRLGGHQGQSANPIRVNVRPVIAVRAEREHTGGPQIADTHKAESAQVASVANAAASPTDVSEPAQLSNTDKPAATGETVETPTALNTESDQAAAVSAEVDESTTASAASQDAAGPDETRATDGNGVPRFKLAEQILAEQRRAASGRRQRAGASDAAARAYAAQDTVGAVIREVKHNLQPSPPTADTPLTAPPRSNTLETDVMTTLQREIIEEIVARDIALFSSVGRRRSWPANQSN